MCLKPISSRRQAKVQVVKNPRCSESWIPLDSRFNLSRPSYLDQSKQNLNRSRFLQIQLSSLQFFNHFIWGFMVCKWSIKVTLEDIFHRLLESHVLYTSIGDLPLETSQLFWIINRRSNSSFEDSVIEAKLLQSRFVKAFGTNLLASTWSHERKVHV